MLGLEDKRPVAFIITISDPNATIHVFRRNKDGTRVPITCPDSVKLYNMYMGGVDLFDSCRKTYSSSRNSMNWWLWLFSFILDTAVVNSYILHKETSHRKALNLKEFLLELVDFLMAFYTCQKCPPTGLNPPVAGWFCEYQFPDLVDAKKQCRVCLQRKRTSYCCKDCSPDNSVLLCPTKCFRIYHTKPGHIPS